MNILSKTKVLCAQSAARSTVAYSNPNAAMTIQAYAFSTMIIAIYAAKFFQNLT
jgi:hypothetical protein